MSASPLQRQALALSGILGLGSVVAHKCAAAIGRGREVARTTGCPSQCPGTPCSTPSASLIRPGPRFRYPCEDPPPGPVWLISRPRGGFSSSLVAGWSVGGRSMSRWPSAVCAWLGCLLSGSLVRVRVRLSACPVCVGVCVLVHPSLPPSHSPQRVCFCLCVVVSLCRTRARLLQVGNRNSSGTVCSLPVNQLAFLRCPSAARHFVRTAPDWTLDLIHPEEHRYTGPANARGSQEDRVPRQTFTPIHVTPSLSCDTKPFRTPKASFPRPRFRKPVYSFGNKPELCSVDPLLPPTNRGRSSGFQIDAGLVFFRFLGLCRPAASLFSSRRLGRSDHCPASVTPSFRFPARPTPSPNPARTLEVDMSC